MKFGHSFKEALEGTSYPKHWVEKAIPYRQLKKVLSMVREELIQKGYDPNTLQKLLTDHDAEYSLLVGESHLLRPRLVVRPELSAVSSLSPELSVTLRTALAESTPPTHDSITESAPEDNQVPSQEHSGWVKIPLNADSRFFNMLQTEVSELDTLQSQERKAMNSGIHILGSEISEVAKPRKGLLHLSKSDLYRWREIFELYLAAQVFFSTVEVAGGSRTSEKAQQQLVWFQEEVGKRQLLRKFKLEASAVAYARFLDLNAMLLQNLQFQELNQMAVTKIIKKFDKQTSLGVKTVFPKVMHSANFIAESIAKNICAQMSQDVLNLVPQIVDYTCTICLSICWLPIRLDCTHMFCIRCMIKMQNRNKRLCPLCRASTVYKATEAHIDIELMHFLEQWFPKETKEKQSSNEIDRRKELLGEAANTDPACCVM
ncbi:SPX domain-containing protein [Podospora didyma]|uniref:SPX domain-containing protein n=1 Tax=Podospora didyma TaxID=330526 RepID=A0AAE0NNE9_9PEZI|nr:SPX domain-containing protein [Podospora didyma]